MGCDIHIHQEVKLNGQWHHYRHVPRDMACRFYGVFQLMAGVRGDPEQAIIPPRGLPDDATELTEHDWFRRRGDWHTPSWFGVAEIKDMERRSKDLSDGTFDFYGYFGTCFGNGWDPATNPAMEDVRWIFWFDN